MVGVVPPVAPGAHRVTVPQVEPNREVPPRVDVGMVRALLERGADANWQGGVGATALVTALGDGDGPDLG